MRLQWIAEHQSLPPTHLALGADSDAPGLLCAGPAVTPQRLDEAYRRGIFPWFSPGQPPLWWAPDPRMVLPVAGFKLSRSLRKTLQRFVHTPGCEIRIDHHFAAVVAACAGTPRAGQQGTWIVPEIAAAYTAWHQAGRAHSVACFMNGELAGGLYGVAMGRMFYGESMFSWRSDASKIALAALVAFCRAHGITLIDCQQNTRHLASLGAHEISRRAFEAHLAQATEAEGPQDWSYHPGLWAQLGLDEANPQRTGTPHTGDAKPPQAEGADPSPAASH